MDNRDRGDVDDHVYLHDLARLACDQPAEFETRRKEWCERFHRTYYQRFGCTVPVAAVEITPSRPPFDYRGQSALVWAAVRRLSGRWSEEESGKPWEPKWGYWREVLVTCPPQPEFFELNLVLRRLADLYLRATNYTDAEDAAFCHRLLRSEVDTCVSRYDKLDLSSKSAATGSTKPEPGDLVSDLCERADMIEDIYKRCAARRTMTQYTSGMLLGLVVVPLLLLATVWLFKTLDPEGISLSEDVRDGVQLGTFFGALGAVSSVLLRISSANVDLDFESTRHGWRFLTNPAAQRGIARVVIGTIFGFVAAWLAHAGILLPEALADAERTDDSMLIVVGVMGYAAGFSERLVPDYIIRTARKS